MLEAPPVSWAAKRRRFLEDRAAQERTTDATEGPASERRFINPDGSVLGLEDLTQDSGGISAAAQEVNDACDTIGIVECYERLSKNHFKDSRRTGEGIMVSCPDPSHPDTNPSAWLNADRDLWHCGACDGGGDKYTLAALSYGLSTRTDFWEVKTRLARDLRGVEYERPRPFVASVPTPGRGQGSQSAKDDTANREWEQRVEEQKNRTLIRLEGDARARQERSSGLFQPPSFADDLETELLQADPEIQWSIDALHAVGGNTTITAGFKVGKTTFVMNLIRALADQEPFLGAHEVRALEGRIAYWNFEVEPAQMKRTFREMKLKKGANVWHLPLRGHTLDLMDDAAYGWALAEMRRQEIEVWILDPFSGAYFGDENDNSQINLFTKRLDEFKREAGIRDLFMPVHTGRYVEEGNERARGGAKLDDWADSRWVLAKHAETGDRYFRAEGRRIEQEERELHYRRDDNTLSYSAFAGTRKQKSGNVLRGELLAFISANPGCSKGSIEAGVHGGAPAIREELRRLVAGLDVVVIPGANRTHHHYIQGQQPLGGTP